MVDFLSITLKNPEVVAQVKVIPLLKKWLELQGFNDTSEFFKKESEVPPVPNQTANLNSNPTPKTTSLNQTPTTQGIIKSAMSPVINK